MATRLKAGKECSIEAELARVRRETGPVAAGIITDAHKAGLRQEMARMRDALAQQEPERARTRSNPLVQYWFVASFERYLKEM